MILNAENEITISWISPTLGVESVLRYRILYKPVGTADDSWSHVETENPRLKFTVKQLDSETEYLFKIEAVSEPGLKKQICEEKLNDKKKEYIETEESIAVAQREYKRQSEKGYLSVGYVTGSSIMKAENALKNYGDFKDIAEQLKNEIHESDEELYNIKCRLQEIKTRKKKLINMKGTICEANRYLENILEHWEQLSKLFQGIKSTIISYHPKNIQTIIESAKTEASRNSALQKLLNAISYYVQISNCTIVYADISRNYIIPLITKIDKEFAMTQEQAKKVKLEIEGNLERIMDEIKRLIKNKQEEYCTRAEKQMNLYTENFRNTTSGSADRLMEGQIVVPCLGQLMSVGMLYDCRKNTPIPGITLWDSETLSSNSKIHISESSDFDVTADDSMESKTHSLNVEAEVKLSFLGGLFKVGGAGKYLENNRSSAHQARVVLKYSCKSGSETLTMNHLGTGKIEHPYIFDNDVATHVVVAIEYGADAIFVFDRKESSSESCRKVEGKLKGSLLKLGVTNISGSGSAQINEEEKRLANGFTCTFHGDIVLKKTPTTFDDAVAVYKELSNEIRGRINSNGLYGAPKCVYLYPLSKLDNRAAKLVRSISNNIVNKTQSILEHVINISAIANDLENSDI
ncbi:hypothetical protein FO519_009594, partial [Halicephalobus sp. NKZ332]